MIAFIAILFQSKISNKYINSGWIHKDIECEFTCIVYLSSHKNCGTSIFDSKKICSEILNNEKKKYTYTKNLFEEEEKYLKENNDQFEETISIKSKFNRCIMFDGANFHAAQKFYENDVQEERLTLIGFFNDIYFPGIKYNGIEHKRIF